MMALAETFTLLGEADNALLYWRHITQNHSYPRAKVQLAELYAAKNQPEAARAELKDVLSDDRHAPAFQRPARPGVDCAGAAIDGAVAINLNSEVH